jgi:hypothetical protein
MKLIFLLMSAALFLSGCVKNYTDFSCINNKIAKIKAQKKWNPPAQVDEYLYQGKKFFCFHPTVAINIIICMMKIVM